MAVEHLCLGCMSYLEKPDAPCPNCGWTKAMKNSASQLQVGYTLTNENQTEKYIIGRRLGQGGFGVSYLAWYTNRAERVVIKEFFPATIANRDNNSQVVMNNPNDTEQFEHGLDNFLKEAYKLLDFSNDPNVVNVKNFFRANNTAYIVMEFVDGQTLSEFIEKHGGRISLDDAINRLAPIAAVLERMHNPKINSAGQILRQPLIHRDVSPDNIIFTRNDTVKLLDFGASRSFETNMTEIIRTGYSPPEQFMSKDPNFIQGAWTDVYALAATIYRAITGQIPPNSVARLGTDSLVLPSSLGVKIEPFQEQALLKGLATDYHKRYQTVSEFINALHPSVSVSSNDKKNLFISSISLSAFGGFVAVCLFIFALDMVIGESIFEADYIISFIASAVSTACLGTLIWDLLEIYRKRSPKFLHNIFWQDLALGAQFVCSLIFLFLAFIYSESWDDSFIAEIQMEFFFNTDFYSDTADAFVNFIIFIYSVVSLAGIWLGRQILQKKF